MADEDAILRKMGVSGAPVLGARGLVHFADRQLTVPGGAVLEREFNVGGPDEGKDRRLVLDLETLEELVAVARQAVTRRVVVHGAGLRVRVYRVTRDGGSHAWEQWYVMGGKVEPEQTGIDPETMTLTVRG